MIVPVIQNWMPLVKTTSAIRQEGRATVDSISVIGGTWTGHALRAVIDTLSHSNLPNRVVVLLTDGATNEEDLDLNPVSQIIHEAREANVKIVAVTVGFGLTSLDEYLVTLADSTNGLFLKAPTCNELANIAQEIATYGYGTTIDREPLPSGHTLSTPMDPQGNRATNSVNILHVSPNPAQDFAEVLVDLKNPQQSTISLYTTNGEMIVQKEVKAQSHAGNTRIRFETSSIATGTYLLVVEDGFGGKDQAKLIIRSNND